MNRGRLFFLHNPKAGGSALRSLLRSMARGSEAPIFSNAPHRHAAEKAGYGQYGGHAYYAGHFGWDEYARLSDRHAVVTNFRDPVARVLSLYRYWRHNIDPASLGEADARDVAIVVLAHRLSFSHFIRHPDVQCYIADFHFRQLHGSGWERAPTHRWARWHVKRRIAQMPWFFIAETGSLSMAMLREMVPGVPALARVNESGGDRIGVARQDADYLRSINRLDEEIYRFALGEQERRLALVMRKAA